MPPTRLLKGGNSPDYQLMFLGDVNAYTTIVDGQALVWNEAIERFIPTSVTKLVTSADDYTSLAAAIADTPEGGTLWLSPDTTYTINNGNFIRKSINIVGGGRSTRIVLASGGTVTCPTIFWFQSAMDSDSATLPYYGPVSLPTYHRTFSGSLSGGEVTFTLASVAGLSVGTNCMLLLGADPYDATQPFVRQWNKVTNISGSDVTFLLPIPETINGTTHKCVTFDKIVENIRLSDLSFAWDGVATAEAVAWFDKCRNIICDNLYIENFQYGVISESCENIALRNIYAEKINSALISGFGVTNGRAENVGVLDCYGVAINFETQCRGFVIDTAMIGRGATAGVGPSSISVLGGSTGIQLSNFRFNYAIKTHTLISSEGSQTVTRNFYFGPNMYCPLQYHEGTLRWLGVTYRGLRSYSINYTIAAGSNDVKLYIPNGPVRKLHVWIDDVTNLGVVNLTPNGDIAGSLSAGVAVAMDETFTTIADPVDYPFCIATGRYFQFLSPLYAGGHLHVYMEYWPSAVDDQSDGLVQSTQ